MTKDKVMQAAGRLRLFGRGQRLRIAATPDLLAKIAAGRAPCSPSAVSAVDVLQWVMGNTVAATQAGVIEWARQGFHFAATQQLPEHALLNEWHRVTDLYSAARAVQPVADLIAVELQRQQARVGPALPAAMAQLMGRIHAQGSSNAEGHSLRAGQAGDEECERELEQEEEQEEEAEVEVPAVQPAQEQDWDWGAAADSTGVEDMARLTPVRKACSPMPRTADLDAWHAFMHDTLLASRR
jgi:hypothetical protein